MQRLSCALRYLLAGFLLVANTACATLESATHKYFKSCKVVTVQDSEAFLSMGSVEGAMIGQEYTVYRFTAVNPPGRRQPPVFRRDPVGTVEITELADHSAKARVVQGEIKANDVARLKTQSPG